MALRIGLLVSLMLLLVYIFPVYPTEKTILLRGSELETELLVNKGRGQTPRVFIIAGIHGNEPAGIKVALELVKTKPQKGVLMILPRANNLACSQNLRTLHYLQDLNREFPGNSQGTETEKLAWEITQVINSFQPDLIIDLHEAHSAYRDDDNVGQALIFTPVKNVSHLILALHPKINKQFPEAPFTYLTGAPVGSINREIAEGLGIPVITVETSMEQALQTRIRQQRYIVNLILREMGMVN